MLMQQSPQVCQANKKTNGHLLPLMFESYVVPFHPNKISDHQECTTSKSDDNLISTTPNSLP
jgi:5-methylcytosine-specific restriction endonuclease McrBC regulatory subunit McrC